jgi:hypothetical protein
MYTVMKSQPGAVKWATTVNMTEEAGDADPAFETWT